MVAKISLGNSLYGALNYNGEKINQEKGRLLDTNKIYNDGTGTVDIKRAFADFMQWMPSTTKTERPMVHISLNPHPDDILTDAQLTEIAREYMDKLGFGDMPYMVYKHTDINRHHMHIVALRVRTDGSCVSDRNNFYRSKEITRELERKYGLRTAERERIPPETPLLRIDPSGDLKKQVAAVVKIVGMRYKFQSIGEYNAVLGLFNVKCENTDGRVNGREYHGLVYFALGEDGSPIAAPFKASRLGKFARREAIDAKYGRSRETVNNTPTKEKVAQALSECRSKDDFIDRLRAVNIDVVMRYTSEGRIYGVTFIDHNTFNVLNGSRLGRAFSANALEAQFNPEPPHEQPQEPIQERQETQESQAETTTNSIQLDSNIISSEPIQPVNTERSHDNDNYDYGLTLPGFEIQQGQSVNPDEEAFIRRMKRQHRRGRKL